MTLCVTPWSRVYLIGPSGSGKTVIARRVAELANLHVVDTDAQIRERSGRSIATIFDEDGEPAFREMELGLLHELASAGEPTIVATGGGLPVIPTAMECMRNTGLTIYLEASAEELWTRVLGDLDERPLLRGPDGYARMVEMLRMREPVYRTAAVTVRTEQLAVPKVVELVRSQLPASWGLRA